MSKVNGRFEVNDTITQLKFDEPIRKGIVISGPFDVDGVHHYTVKWEWEHEQHGTPSIFKKAGEDDLICDLISTKYRYV